MKWLCCIRHFSMLSYGFHLRNQLFPWVTVPEHSRLLSAEGMDSPRLTKGSQAEVLLLRQGGEGSSPCLLWHSQEFGVCWGAASLPFVLLSCTEAACWNVSVESTQDSTCPGLCLASLHNFVLPYGSLVICSQERKWFPFVLMTTLFFQLGTSLAGAVAGIMTYS